MKIRTKLLLTCVTGAFVIGAGPMISASHAADTAMPKKAMPAAEPVPFWWFHGEVEVGGRVFLNHPQRDGVASQGGNSLAKYYEYSSIKPGPFSNIWLSTGTSDGLYQFDVWGKNIGYTDQRFDFTASKAGEHYFNFEWDQTPHVYSTSARTLYNGVGTTALTLPTGLGTALFNASGNTTNVTPANANTPVTGVRAIIDANVHQTDIGIRRDTAAVEYRWTPTTSWDISANYSHMHRTGTQIDGVVMSPGTGDVRVDAVKPVDDTTQNFGLNGEYAGTSPWNQKFNFKLGYNGSVYKDADSAYTVQNPFCQDPADGGLCAQGATQQGTSNTSSTRFNQMPLWPSNNANSVTATLGADLPAKSRYMGTASFTNMRQNDAFLPFTITPGLGFLINGQAPNSLAALPASSLNGSINTLLVNNVLTTQITPDLKSKLTYRYYDYDNNTPEILMSNWVISDYRSASSRSADYAPAVGVQRSYTRQNAGAELTWQPTRQWNLGVAYGFERYDWTRADADVTNEHSGKVFADWKPMSWWTTRASYRFAERRYENYDNYNNLSHIMFPNDAVNAAVMQNQSYRQLMYSNRDRNEAKFSTSVDVTKQFTLTPNGGLRYDNYLNNVNLGTLNTGCTLANSFCVGTGAYNGVPLIGTQPGLKHNNAWNVGLEASYIFNPDTTFLLSYMREYRDQQILWCGDANAATASGFTSQGGCSAFSNSATTGTGFPSGSNDATMKDTVDTFIARMRYAAIPNKLDFDFGYTLSIARSSTSINPGPFPSFATSGTTPAVGTTTVAGGPFPDVKTIFQRVDVITIYKLDQDLVQRMGYKGEVTAKFRYAFESTKVTNWQNDQMQTYMWSTNNQTVGYMTWLAGDNPNYNVHLFAASLAFKW